MKLIVQYNNRLPCDVLEVLEKVINMYKKDKETNPNIIKHQKITDVKIEKTNELLCVKFYGY